MSRIPDPDPTPVSSEMVPVRPADSAVPDTVRRLGGAALGAASRVASPDEGRLPWPVDAVIGAGAIGVEGTAVVAGALVRVTRPVVALVMRPPLVPEAWTPATRLARLAARGRAERVAGERSLDDVLDSTVPAVTTMALERLDLTALVLDNVDLDAIVTTALDGLDLTEVVLARVDLEAIVTRALDELDLTDVVLTRVELEPIVMSALDGLDLTSVVLDRVDLGRVVDGALDQVDLNAVVRERVDLPGIAEEVIDQVDLPEIIRESTGGIATEAVRGVRMQSIDADERINRVIDRVLLRRKQRHTDAEGEPLSLLAEALVRDAPESGEGRS